MKELSIEQKAKAYDEVKKSVESLLFDAAIRHSKSVSADALANIIPALKEESEDENIRKELINTFKEATDSLYMVLTPSKREAFIAWLEKQGEQKPAEWSEEDENSINNICGYIKGHNKFSDSCKESAVKFLKSLKDRVQPKPRQEYDDMAYEMSRAVLYDKLKDSLRPQSTWKPSEEQMKALEHFVRSIGESGYASPYDNTTKLLYSLLADLKKLREE